jgi:hypothetical protein
MMPGQLGPISLVLLCSLIAFFTLTCQQQQQQQQQQGPQRRQLLGNSNKCGHAALCIACQQVQLPTSTLKHNASY